MSGIMTTIPYGARVSFRASKADHYEQGKVFGFCVVKGKEKYNVEADDRRRFYNLEDVKEVKE